MRVVFDHNPDIASSNESCQSTLQKLTAKAIHILSVPLASRKEFKYVVLKNRFLFMYSDGEEMKDCVGAIFLEDVWVEILSESNNNNNDKDKDVLVKDNSTKRVLKDNQDSSESRDPSLYRFDRPIKLYSKSGAILAQNPVCYLYSVNAYEKEDWFFAFLAQSKHANDQSLASRFPMFRVNPSYLANYMSDLDSRIQSNLLMDERCKWVNVLMGRVFFNIHHSQALKDHFLAKFKRILARSTKPSFLASFEIVFFPLIPSTLFY